MAPVSRRSFLAGFTGLSVFMTAQAVRAGHTAPPSDSEHSIGPWRVRWMGWKEPGTQPIKFGYWFAYHASDRQRFLWIASTLGRIQRLRELEIIDMSYQRQRGWPLTALDSPDRFEAAKVATYRALKDALIQAESPSWVEWPSNGFRPNGSQELGLLL